MGGGYDNASGTESKDVGVGAAKSGSSEVCVENPASIGDRGIL